MRPRLTARVSRCRAESHSSERYSADATRPLRVYLTAWPGSPSGQQNAIWTRRRQLHDKGRSGQNQSTLDEKVRPDRALPFNPHLVRQTPARQPTRGSPRRRLPPPRRRGCRPDVAGAETTPRPRRPDTSRFPFPSLTPAAPRPADYIVLAALGPQATTG